MFVFRHQGTSVFGSSGRIKCTDVCACVCFVALVPQDAKEGVVVEKRYALSRRIVFKIPKGGERVWILKEALNAAITEGEIKINGKEVKVRVQDSPDKESKRGNFWRAVAAIETLVDKDAIILEPRFCCMYATSSHETLGKASVDSFDWDIELIK